MRLWCFVKSSLGDAMRLRVIGPSYRHAPGKRTSTDPKLWPLADSLRNRMVSRSIFIKRRTMIGGLVIRFSSLRH
jgi:hypothetical protein